MGLDFISLSKNFYINKNDSAQLVERCPEFHHQQKLNFSTLKIRLTDVSDGDFQNSYFLGCTIVNNQINSRPLKLPKSDHFFRFNSLKVRFTDDSDGDFQNSYFLGCTIVNNQINSRSLKLPKSDTTKV